MVSFYSDDNDNKPSIFFSKSFELSELNIFNTFVQKKFDPFKQPIVLAHLKYLMNCFKYHKECLLCDIEDLIINTTLRTLFNTNYFFNCVKICGNVSVFSEQNVNSAVFIITCLAEVATLSFIIYSIICYYLFQKNRLNYDFTFIIRIPL